MEVPQFKSLAEQEAYMKACLSEGICPCCRTNLNTDRTCGMGYTWDIHRGVIISGPEPSFDPPIGPDGQPAKGLWQIMGPTPNYNLKPIVDPEKVLRYMRDKWPIPKVEVTYNYSEAEANYTELMEATKRLASKMATTNPKWAKFAELYGGDISDK